MAISQIQQDNLFKAFGLFIEAFRPYVVERLQQEAGDKWPVWFVEALFPTQKESWNIGLRAGTLPEALIDYPYLKSFVLKYKDLIKKDFGKDHNKLASRLETIYDVRNKLAHFQSIKPDEFSEVFIHMKNIAHSLNLVELGQELEQLQEARGVVPEKREVSAGLQPWFRVVTPHSDIRQGRLDESVFAANLAEVALGHGREIYNNPVVFFSKTYFTAGLKSVARTVIKGLNGQEDAENRVISLQTGFGGGKTHTLISLYHICRWGKSATQSQYAAELLSFTGQPQFENANIAVFTNTTNDPANGRQVSEGFTIQTIWGELAYQLGGVEAYDIIRKNDEQLIAPGGMFKKVLEKCTPALILIDELADYCVKASARKAGESSLADQTISFMQELTEAVAGVNHCVAVITLPASAQEVGNTPQATNILTSLQKRVSRVGADTQPVSDDEVFEVIRRRLFEEVGDADTMNAVASKYTEYYQQLWSELPPHANKVEYKQRILKSYPFHPDLIDIFRVRWASHNDFQRTRGVLRLLAAIVSDLWKRQQSSPGANLLIHSGAVNFANLDALSGQLKKLYGNGYDAVISADVAGSSSNAFKIDSNKTEYGQWYLAESIASVILMSSFGSDGANKGVSIPEIKLHLLTPDGFNHNNVNGALDELESGAYYLYWAQTGGAAKRYWFHTKPNINILINQAKADVKSPDIDAEINKRIREKTHAGIHIFNAIANPLEDVAEQIKPTLIILSPEHLGNPAKVNGRTITLIEKLATKKGNSDRIYRNTMLFLICSEAGIGQLHNHVREYLACQMIKRDYQLQLEKEQKDDINKKIEESSKQTESSIVAAYSIVVKYSVKNGPEILSIREFTDTLDKQINNNIVRILKAEEWLLESVGSSLLRNHNLLPTTGHPIKAKDVYEAFLRFDDKPMITNPNAVSSSIVKYCHNGEFGVATGDGRDFTRYFFKESIPFFDPTDATYWLVDKADLPEAVAPSIPKESTGNGKPESSPITSVAESPSDIPGFESVKKFNSITISGRLTDKLMFTQLSSYFIVPFKDNNIDIEVTFHISSTPNMQLDETKQQYKSAKEAAKQLGMRFEEEP